MNNEKGKKKLSQREIILEHMKKYKSITTMEGFYLYNITCVTQRIFDLIREGFDIRKEPVYETRPDGSHVSYTRYILEGFRGGAIV